MSHKGIRHSFGPRRRWSQREPDRDMGLSVARRGGMTRTAVSARLIAPAPVALVDHP
jgi:hypothetical protein